MAWSWKGFCSLCGAAVCAGVCIATGGVAAGPLLAYSAGAGGLGFFIGDKADQENTEREIRLEQNQRYKEVKQEANQQENVNNQTKNTILDIEGKLNGNIPRQPNETDEYLKGQLIVAQQQLKNGESRLSDLRSTVDTMRKELGGNNNLLSLLGLNKLSFTEKIMIIAGIVLVIYLVKG